jgi:hypothetical protein
MGTESIYVVLVAGCGKGQVLGAKNYRGICETVLDPLSLGES